MATCRVKIFQIISEQRLSGTERYLEEERTNRFIPTTTDELPRAFLQETRVSKKRRRERALLHRIRQTHEEYKQEQRLLRERERLKAANVERRGKNGGKGRKKCNDNADSPLRCTTLQSPKVLRPEKGGKKRSRKIRNELTNANSQSE